MIQGTFDVAIDTPKYHRRGTLSMMSAGDNIVMRLTPSELEAMEFVGKCADKTFSFEGSGNYPSLGEIDYKATGELWGNTLEIKCETSAGVVTIFGTRLSGTAGDLKSSHEYLMKASAAEFDRNDSTMYSGLYSDGN